MNKKLQHNWTKETMYQCADVHLGQLADRWFNWVQCKGRDDEITRIFDSYRKIKMDVESKNEKIGNPIDCYDPEDL